MRLRSVETERAAERDKREVSQKTVHHLPAEDWVTIPVFDGDQARRFAL
jgi:hypothetical protein